MQCMCNGCYCDGGEYNGVAYTHDVTWVTTETVDSLRLWLENNCVRFNVFFCICYWHLLSLEHIYYVSITRGLAERLSRQYEWTGYL